MISLRYLKWTQLWVNMAENQNSLQMFRESLSWRNEQLCPTVSALYLVTVERADRRKLDTFVVGPPIHNFIKMNPKGLKLWNNTVRKQFSCNYLEIH
jgi:hypothetical protein